MILCRSEDRLQAMSVSLLHLHIIADEVDEFQAGGLPLRVSWPMTPVVFPRHAPNHLPSSCFSQVSSVCFWCSLDPTSFQQHFNHKNSSSSMDPYGPARFQAAPHGMSHHLLDDSPVMLQPLRRRWGIAQIRACAPEGLDGTAGAAKV